MADNWNVASLGNEWNALDKLFQDSDALTNNVPKPSYGADAPVAYKGPSPGSIGPAKAAAPKKSAAAPPKDTNSIWSEDEVGDAGDVDDIDDGRRQPEYDIVFKQNVRPEDMFLGIDPLRHEGVRDELLLKVQLPGTKLADIDLDVRPTFVRLQAPQYKLKAYLPEQVDDQRGGAKWDASKELLTVTLPVVGNFDAKLPTSSANDLD